MIKMYGIPNCDTIKKAKKWLKTHNIEYTFHDYKKDGVDSDVLKQSIHATAVDQVVNKRGTTYRKLSESQQQQLSEDEPNIDYVIELLCQHPSMIKRPILVKKIGEQKASYILGFSESSYQALFDGA